VPEQSYANRVLEYMVLTGENLWDFSLVRLCREKRNKVRKGLKSCEVILISDIEKHLENIRQINISQTQRVMNDPIFFLPYTYYIEHQERWKAHIRRSASMRGHQWWGAFFQGHVVSYSVTCQVENVLFIKVTKTHTNYLKMAATDALIFTILEQASRSSGCERVVNGSPARESLNRFKEQFLFKRTEAFYYSSGAGLHKMAKAILYEKDRARAYWQRLYGKYRAGKYLSSDQEPMEQQLQDRPD
jgi:hypothetical protein